MNGCFMLIITKRDEMLTRVIVVFILREWEFKEKSRNRKCLSYFVNLVAKTLAM